MQGFIITDRAKTMMIGILNLAMLVGPIMAYCYTLKL